MTEKEEMLRNLTSKAVTLPLMGAAVLSTVIDRVGAQEPSRPVVRSEMLVSTSWLEQHLNDRGLVVLYIGRDRNQFDSGHIPGAHFVRLDDLVDQRTESLNELPSVADLQATFESLGVSDHSRIVLADDAGGVLAARAFFTLDYLGHADQVALVDGGLKVWMAQSRPTSKEESPVARAKFSVLVHPDILVTTARMRQLSLGAEKGDTDYALLDARPLAEFTGLVKSEAVSRAGHIAGSQSLYWKNLIHSDLDPRLRDRNALLEQFARSGARPGKPVITYCRTGMQSSFTYFVARYLGYPAAMYDGSVYEWVRAGGLPLVSSPAPQGANTAHP